jgi:hypothetical protein
LDKLRAARMLIQTEDVERLSPLVHPVVHDAMKMMAS